MDAIKAQLGPDVLALPEQLFGGSAVVLSHPASGLMLRFDAHDALQGVQLPLDGWTLTNSNNNHSMACR